LKLYNRKIVSSLTLLILATTLIQMVSGATFTVISNPPAGPVDVDINSEHSLSFVVSWSGVGDGRVAWTVDYPDADGYTYNRYEADLDSVPFDMGAPTINDGDQIGYSSTTVGNGVFTLTFIFDTPGTPGGPHTFTSTGFYDVGMQTNTHQVNLVATYGVTLTPATSTERVLTGNDPVHTINVLNDGNVQDTFTLSYTGTGTAGYSTNPVVLAAGANQDIDVTITGLPDGTTTGTLTATSAGDASTDTATLVSEVQAPGVTVTPATVTKIGAKDQEMTHTFTVTNTGNYADTFDIAVTAGPGSVLPVTVGPIAPAGTDTFVLTVPAPGVVQVDVTDVTATSQADGTVSDTATATSDFKDYAVTVTPDPSDKSVVSGSDAVHTLTITNAGGIPDTYDIAYAGDLSPTVSDSTVTLAPGATQDITVTYTSPPVGDHTGTITATSQAPPAVSDTATLNTKVATYGVTLTDPSEETVLSGSATAVHTITVTNTGSHQDTFDLSYTGDLVPVLSDASVTLASGASTDVTVTYNAPPDGVHVGTLTAESTLIPVGSATDTSTLTTDVNRYGVTVTCTTTPLAIRSGLSGTHSFTIENTGNVQDTFDLALTGDLLASATLSRNTVTIAAGGTTAVTMTLTTPPDGLNYMTTLTATSQGAPTLGGTAEDNDVAETDVKTYGVTVENPNGKTLSEIVKVAAGTEVHTFTVTNNGNDADTFTIVLTGDGTLSDPTLTIASGGSDTFTVTHGTAAAGIYSSTVTVTSDGYAGAKATVYAKTFACEAGKHVTDNSANAAGTFNLDATATVPFELDITVTDAVVVDFYQLPGDPRPTVSKPKSKVILFGTFTVDDESRVTAATGTVHYTDNQISTASASESSLSVYYWNEVGWVQATSVVLDSANNMVSFTIDASHWLERSYDYDFALLASTKPSGGKYVPPPSPKPPTQDEFDDLKLNEKVETIEELDLDDAAALIGGSSTEDAAEVLEAVSVGKAKDIIVALEPDQAADIFEKLSTEAATKIVEEAASTDELDEIAQVLVEAEPDTVANVLLNAETDTAANVIREMGTADLASTAERVEKAIKKEIEELDEPTKQAYREKIKAVIENPALTVEDLVNLFVEIANLPETPSTVAEIFEIIELNKTLEVVDGMIAKDKLTEIGLVFGYLSDAKLVEIYTAMTSAARTVVYPYFDAATLARLPELTTFSVSASVSPATVEAGSPVTVTAQVSNTGDEVGSLTVTLKVNDVQTESEVVTLAAGESTTLTWTVTKTTAGTYTVDVNGETATFTVESPPEPPAPAEFETSNLSVSPATITPGEDITVTVDVENVGEESGSYTVEAKLDGATVDSESVTLVGGASTTVALTVTSETEGSHTVQVDDLSASFTVETPPKPFPWIMVILGALIVVTAIGYYLYRKQQQEA